MDNVPPEEAIRIGLTVAFFLFHTFRSDIAFDLFLECLMLLKDFSVNKEGLPDFFSKGVALQLGSIFFLNRGLKFYKHGRMRESIQYLEKAPHFNKEIGCSLGEAWSLCHLGRSLYVVCRYDEAVVHYQKALQVPNVTGTQRQRLEGTVYNNLGEVYQRRGRYDKARSYFEKALNVSKAVGDKTIEATSYNNLGVLYHNWLGKLDDALVYHQKALEMRKALEDRSPEAVSYNNIGGVYQERGDYNKALEFYQKGLLLSKEINNRRLVGTNMSFIGKVYRILGNYEEAEQYLEEAVKIHEETGVREDEEAARADLGHVYISLGKYKIAKNIFKKNLEMCEEINSFQGKEPCYSSLSLVCSRLGEHEKAIEYLNKGMNIRIKNHQTTRGSLTDEPEKLSLDSQNYSYYKTLSMLLLVKGEFSEGLLTSELGRGRVLVDLLSKKYGIQRAADTNEVTPSILQRFLRKQKRNFLFIAMLPGIIALWFADKSGNINFKKSFEKELSKGKKVYDTRVEFEVDREVQCEDRSLSALYYDRAEKKEQKKHVIQKENESQNERRLQFNAFIAPIAELIESSEIIIAPEGPLLMIAFAALQDENGKYLSDKVRIRLVPSLTTLKLIYDSPADYHCKTGALIVGDPKVGPVEFKGDIKELCQLPKAREEAQMISRLLGVPCLVGEQATKEEVLKRIQEVSLVHIAAHGDAERGEIALAPNSSVTGIPKKKDFMLTVKDVAEVGIRAKLVVLSCCHSARGKILTAEGVVGIARAFLSSGARSVLMSLWEVDDEATKAFMEVFYECLVCEKMSASEARHQAMKKMRESPLYKDVEHWAPFVLLGDDVTLDFTD